MYNPASGKAGDVPLQGAVEGHTEELARLVTAEHGKVYSDTLGSLPRGLEVVELACGIPHLLKGRVQRAEFVIPTMK